MYEPFIAFVRNLYATEDFIPLHEPTLGEREKELVCDAIDSTFVSSVGAYVERFEESVARFVGAHYAVATVNGTAALHTALLCVGVKPGSLVLTQPLTFVATCNAIAYCGADPLFLDVEEESLGLDPEALERYLRKKTYHKAGRLVDKASGRDISAVVPMHTFGTPCRIDRIAKLCESYGLPLVEDAAESLGSRLEGKHTGTFGRVGIFSFNGNKILTTGGGGMLVTDDEKIARRARHLTTTAKLSHPYRYLHDVVGFNYRLPNLNAALGCAQMERLPSLLERKRELARQYQSFFRECEVKYIKSPPRTESNHWLNAVRFDNAEKLERFLAETNAAGVMTRPLWEPMYRLPMYECAPKESTPVTEALAATVANIPSSPLKIKGWREDS